MIDVKTKVEAAVNAAQTQANTSESERTETLHQLARAIDHNREGILEANREDVRRITAKEDGQYSDALIERLKLDGGKIDSIIDMINSVAEQGNVLGETIEARRLDTDLQLYKVRVPIGVIGAVFEARPDAFIQIATLCLKSGNAAVLKGGNEAEQTNHELYKIISGVLSSSPLHDDAIQHITTEQAVRNMLKMDDTIDLLAPRGSEEFVNFVQNNTRIPVLGHAKGVCHIYIDRDADKEDAIDISIDAKTDYPAVCNAVETILVHQDIAGAVLPDLVERFEKDAVTVKGCNRTRNHVTVEEATDEDWKTEYNGLTVAVKIVEGLQEAVDHVNQHGSGHTDSIVTQNDAKALHFVQHVDTASAMINASTRFSDGYRYGLGAEVGISTGKTHARGPVGIKGLTTTKYYLFGGGHTVSDYHGNNGKQFNHEDLSDSWASRLEVEG